MRRPTLLLIAGIFAAGVFLAAPQRLAANVIDYSGNLRVDATVRSCGIGY